MPVVVAVEDEEEEGESQADAKKKDNKKGKRKDRTLVFDEQLGHTIAVKGRKRGTEVWEDEM